MKTRLFYQRSRSRTHYAREIKTMQFYSYGYPYRLRALIPVSKTELSKELLKRRGIWKCRLSFLGWTKRILKRELLEIDDFTVITSFLRPSFPQTRIQIDRWLLHWVFIFLRRSVDRAYDARLQYLFWLFIRFLVKCTGRSELLHIECKTVKVCFIRMKTWGGFINPTQFLCPPCTMFKVVSLLIIWVSNLAFLSDPIL